MKSAIINNITNFINSNYIFVIISVIVIISLVSVSFLFKENFELVWPEPNVYPACSTVTLKDLTDIFDGNVEKLKTAMHVSRVPYNIELSDLNAPLIATYLINHGHQITEQCRLA